MRIREATSGKRQAGVRAHTHLLHSPGSRTTPPWHLKQYNVGYMPHSRHIMSQTLLYNCPYCTDREDNR